METKQAQKIRRKVLTWVGIKVNSLNSLKQPSEFHKVSIPDL